MAARRRQWRRLVEGDKGCSDDLMRAVTAAAVDGGVGGGRRWSRRGEGGRGGEDAEGILCYPLLYVLSRLSKQKSGNFPGDFQQTSRNSTASCYRTR